MLDKTKTSTPVRGYSLVAPLPSDAVAHAAGGPGVYRNYPVFSAPWFWRRTAIFAPIAAVVGLAQSALVGAGLGDWRLGALCAAVGVPIWVAIVTAGPALATWVRHRRLSLKSERVAIVVALLLGLAISFTGQFIADEFGRTTLQPRYRAIMSVYGALPRRTPSPVFITVVVACQLALFVSLGGGLALRAYFSEQRRWREAQHAYELESLRQQKSESDLRLTVLQAQVEPHFLFNTLASIHSLVRKDPQRAEATVEALVDHLRATMPKLRAGIGSAHSTLDEQLEVCESYLAVMQIRMGSRLRYTIDVPADLRSHPFPPLVLISLVENAIKHGIEPSPAGGNIVLSAVVEEHGDARQLAVSVIDDGVGLRPGAGGGVGLENIRAQLAACFGARGGLSIHGRVVAGVSATIRVPYEEPKS
jgi:two-component sensor histidine kinase